MKTTLIKISVICIFLTLLTGCAIFGSDMQGLYDIKEGVEIGPMFKQLIEKNMIGYSRQAAENHDSIFGKKKKKRKPKLTPPSEPEPTPSPAPEPTSAFKEPEETKPSTDTTSTPVPNTFNWSKFFKPLTTTECLSNFESLFSLFTDAGSRPQGGGKIAGQLSNSPKARKDRERRARDKEARLAAKHDKKDSNTTEQNTPLKGGYTVGNIKSIGETNKEAGKVYDILLSISNSLSKERDHDHAGTIDNINSALQGFVGSTKLGL